MILDEITALAASSKTNLADLLRKCLILAHTLKNDRLKAWANQELNGYADNTGLPPYRTIGAGAHGYFIGHWDVPSWPIAPQFLEERHRRWAETVYLNQGVAAYEDLILLPANKGTLSIHWPTTLTLYYQNRLPMTGGVALKDAWQEIPRSAITELLDTVRNRTLNLALELKDEVGDDDTVLKHLSQTSTEKVEKAVVQQIFQGTVYLASGNASMQIQNNRLTPGDWNQLAKALSSVGIAPTAVNELSKEIVADTTPTGSPPGTRVLDWIKKQAPNVVSGGVKIGASVGQSLLTEYLKQHYGIH